MKKIIGRNRLFAMAACVLLGCQTGGRGTPVARTNEKILQEVTEVNAIGKVVPAGGWAIVASPVAARVHKLLARAGDTVTAGQPLLVLESGNAGLEVLGARSRLANLQAENRSTLEDLRKAKLYAAELKDVYETSIRLLAQGAETRKKAAADFSDWQQQEATIRALEQKIHAQRAAEEEQTIQIQKAENQRDDFRITAPTDGVITEWTAKVG